MGSILKARFMPFTKKYTSQIYISSVPLFVLLIKHCRVEDNSCWHFFPFCHFLTCNYFSLLTYPLFDVARGVWKIFIYCLIFDVLHLLYTRCEPFDFFNHLMFELYRRINKILTWMSFTDLIFPRISLNNSGREYEAQKQTMGYSSLFFGKPKRIWIPLSPCVETFKGIIQRIRRQNNKSFSHWYVMKNLDPSPSFNYLSIFNWYICSSQHTWLQSWWPWGPRNAEILAI